MQIDNILVDQAQISEASRQVRAGHFDLSVAFGFQLADRTPKIALDQPGVGTDRFQRTRDDPFRLVSPGGGEVAFVCVPFRMIVIPVTHDLIHLATVHAARLPPRRLDEVTEERGARPERRMIDIAVQGLVHSEHELGHAHFLSFRVHPHGVGLSWAIGQSLDRLIVNCNQFFAGEPLARTTKRARSGGAHIALGLRAYRDAKRFFAGSVNGMNSDKCAFRIAELHRTIAPRHQFRRMNKVDFILQPDIFGVDIVHHELDDRRSVGAGLGAAFPKERNGFHAADGECRRRGDDLGEDRCQPLGRLQGDHFVEADHSLDISGDQPD
ncbi:hypothetical protein RHECNPAF_2530050 [Rhizobium etli CNPAF512]|nr:hypothetical protein RHECNPAF_2530050 [Rhizobium etli CNPAF512]